MNQVEGSSNLSEVVIYQIRNLVDPTRVTVSNMMLRDTFRGL
jgi:hypothetical protein